MVVIGFATPILVGTGLLMLPAASAAHEPADLVTALFTATSAVCVTGHIVVDTPVYWSTFGQVVIVVLIQLGGLGLMTVASLLAILVARRVGLRLQLTAQAETKSLGLGEIRRVVAGVVMVSLAVEAIVAVALISRLWIGHDEPFGRAAYLGVFHAVSAFNNAGFSLYSDSLTRFVSDPYVNVTIMVAVVAGGIGFPVLFELGRRLRTKVRRRHQAAARWSLHLKITVLTYGALLLVGAIVITVLEWRNPATLGPLAGQHKLLAGLFHSVTPRTAGFNTLDVAQLRPSTLLVTDILMFIGGGSAGTAGGIKVATFALLGYVMLAEIRGEPTVHVMGRRLGADVQRQALTVVLLSVGAVATATVVLLAITPFRLDQVLFEVVSAYGTVGLSTGITGDLPVAGELLIVLLMFFGRIGPITLASALALRARRRRYELPEERPIVG